MGKLGENLHDQYHANNEIQKKPTKNMMMKKKPLKVTYISSPVMVTAATASEFRAIVQELTGKDSDAEAPSPHEKEEGLTTFSREQGGAMKLPADHPCSTADLPSRWHAPSDGWKNSHVEAAASDVFLDNSLLAVHGLGFYESF